LGTSQSAVTSLEDELRQCTQEADDMRSQLEQLKAELAVSACHALCFVSSVY